LPVLPRVTHAGHPRIAYLCPERPAYGELRRTIERSFLAGRTYQRYDHVAGYTVYVYDRTK